METRPQPFFVRGPSAVARLTAFGLAALVLMFVDSRFRALDSVRSVIHTVLVPMQQAALLPLHAWRSVSDWFESRQQLQAENATLKTRALADAQVVQGYGSLALENARLRALLSLRAQSPLKSVSAEVVYTGRDPFSQRVFIDRGDQHGVRAGQAVIDGNGVIGQVTRTHPFVSEVTLVSEKDHAVPVVNERTGVRFVMFGRGAVFLPELRFAPASADLKVGDTLVTSGIDGVYPASLAVAKIVSVNKDAGQIFSRVACEPLSGIAVSRQLLVLELPPAPPPKPAAPVNAVEDKPRGKK